MTDKNGLCGPSLPDEDDLAGCIFSGSGGLWPHIDQSALVKRLIAELPPELRPAARKGLVVLRPPLDQPPSKPEDQDV